MKFAQGSLDKLVGNLDISDEDYTHAQKVWDILRCKSMGDYHDFYMKTDVLLLADVMEDFRDKRTSVCGLDALHCYMAPGLAWEEALKTTNVELDHITDPTMHFFIEKGIHGGVSVTTKRHAVTNNKYLKDYETRKVYIFHILTLIICMNWRCLSHYQPHGFEWMTDRELAKWQNIPCFLEASLRYPRELHDLHNNLPLAPDHVMVGKVRKLIPNLNDKVEYITHYKALKQYISMGLEITKVHHGVKSEERPWLAEYIEKIRLCKKR